MPFDGVNYGLIALITPQEYHPAAPSVPAVVGKSLAGSYSYCRTSAGRRIGDQTYRISLRDHGALVPAIRSTSYETVAHFENRWIPGHATHVIARVHIQALGRAGYIEASALVAASNGGGTDTGNATSRTVDIEINAQPQAQGEGLFTSPTVVECSVALSNITDDAGVDVAVTARVLDTNSTAHAWRPEYIVAWWESRE